MNKFSMSTVFAGIVFFLLLTYGPARGDNEVQVSTPSGDTIYVGQTVTFQFSIANSDTIAGIQLEFNMEGVDGASWKRADPPSVIPQGTRLYAATQDFAPPKVRFFPDSTDEVLVADTFSLLGTTIYEPFVSPGELEYTHGVSIVPQSTGQICIDSGCALGCPYTSWTFVDINAVEYDPLWEGPYCFTVVEPPAGDVNCDGAANISDAVYLIEWIFKSGPPPCH